MIVMPDFLSTDLNSLVQIEQFIVLLYFLYCSRISRFMVIILTRCCLYMVAAARTWSKNYSGRHPSYLLEVVQSIVHHYIWRRCSFHRLRDVSIEWWRILMMMADDELWYSVFVNLTLPSPFLSPASGSMILCASCNLHLSIWLFNTFSLVQLCKQYWQK